MNEEKLQRILKNIDIPEPSEYAKEEAINAATQVFKEELALKKELRQESEKESSVKNENNEKYKNNSKGYVNSTRLTSKTNNDNLFWRTMMKKSHVIGGSATALVLVLMVGIFTQYDAIRIDKMNWQPISKNSISPIDTETSNKLSDKNLGRKQKTNEAAARGELDNNIQQQILSIPQATDNRMVTQVISSELLPSVSELSKLKGSDSLSTDMTASTRDNIIERQENLDGDTVDILADEINAIAEKEIAAAPQKAEQKNSTLKIKEKSKKTTDKSFISGLAGGYATVGKSDASIIASHRLKTIMPYPRPYPNPTICCDYPTPPIYREQNRDNFEKFVENDIKQVSKEPVSTFSIDVDTASYAFMRKSLNNGNMPNKNSIRIEELINYFDYDYKLPSNKSEPFKPYISIFPTPWNENSKLLHIGIQGYDIDKSERPKANLVFLIDVSGSMNAPDKLPLLKNSMRMMVNSLNPDDTISIAVYAGAAGAVLEPTSVMNKHKILAAIDRFNAGGSTAGGAGINLAYNLAQQNFDKNAVNRIILATDGDFNVGLRNTEDLKKLVEQKRKSGVFLSVLGFGKGNYNDALMQTLAQNGNGNASYIDNLNEARKVLVDEAGSTLFTIAKDVKIQIEFNPKTIAEYRLIGYETRKLKREDFNNDKVDAGEIGAGHEVTALYEIVTTDAKSKMIDNLRYGSKENKESQDKNSEDKSIIKYGSKSEEYGFFKLRYKLPNESKSRLISTPITKRSEVESITNASKEDRFAASVAAFAQLLKGSKYIYDYSFKQAADLAATARGNDKLGYRNEFVRLVRLAESLSESNDGVEILPIKPILREPMPMRYR